jgi:phage terminase small subunit
MELKTARSPDPSLPVPSDTECGEAMRLLTPSQRAFVVALVESGAENHTQCAMRAGYSDNAKAASVISTRMMRNPKIIAAIREEADRALQGDALLGRAVLVSIAKDVRHKDRFKAGVELLNRAGLLVETRQRITIEDNRDDNALREEVQSMLEKLFAQPVLPKIAHAETLHAPPVAALDGEFTEVDPNDISDIMCDV